MNLTLNIFIQMIVLITLLSLISGVKLSTDSVRSCEPIRIDMCRGLGYNVTGMPNMVGHELQQDAELQLQTFTPLIQYGCSSQLKFFLCAVYTPMCTDKVPISIGPCRPLCESVKARCQPVLLEFGFPWPAALNCSKFPEENNHQHMCMEGPEPEEHERKSKYPVTPVNPKHPRRPKLPKTKVVVPPEGILRGGTPPPIGPGVVSPNMETRKHHFNLCLEYKYFDQYYYINRTERCAHNCSADILFTNDNKHFASIWTAIWAALCFLSTLFTISTFLADSSGFRYPERAIIFLAVNYMVYSAAYLYRLVVGRTDVSCHIDSQHNVPILIQEGLDNVHCTVIFTLLYFFGMASAVWWLILALTWFLAAGLRWTPERIENKYTYFHLIAWILPALKTLAILVMRIVDADELTGTCYVGNQSRSSLLYFVILPMSIYLLVGTLFLILGLVAKVRQPKPICRTCIIPTRHRHGSHHSSSSSHPHLLSQSQTSNCSHSTAHSNVNKLGTPMARVGIFALFYTVPATCVLGANIYEYLSRDSWYLVGQGSINDRPNVEIFTLKIFMSLVIGIKTGLWMWSSKAPFHTWKKVGKRLVQKKQPLPVYLQSVNGCAQHKQQLITSQDSNRSKRPRVKGGNETAV